MKDNFYMQLALDAAWKHQLLTFPNPAVGAVVLDGNGKILSAEAHERAGEAHAEVKALAKAYEELSGDSINGLNSPEEIHDYLYENHNNIFSKATLYVTLEPCNHQGATPPCSLLIEKLGLERVVIAHEDINKEASGGAQRLRDSGIKVKMGVLKSRAALLLEPFSIWQERPFVFFKWAQRLSGSIDGGIISSITSRKEMHSLRDRSDLLIIGGNTVRIDHPKLDARHVNGKAPDVLIYSKSDDFDRNIPLFNVPDRKVIIADNFEIIQDYKMVMIEGGGGMVDATKDIVDWYLTYISESTQIGEGIRIKIALSRVYIDSSNKDIKLWSKRRG